MAVFAKNLFAMSAFIDRIQSLFIKVKAAIYGGDRFTEDRGAIIDHGKNRRGFCLDENGLLRASGAEISGHIEADSGYMEHIIIGKTASFEGNINSGPLFASNEIITPPAGTTWQANTTASKIGSDLGIGVLTQPIAINISSGSYGSRTGLTQLEFSTFLLSGSVSNPFLGLRLRMKFSSGSDVVIQDTWNSGRVSGRITQILNIGGGQAGQTFRLNNIPTAAGSYPEGTVWRDSSGYLRIV